MCRMTSYEYINTVLTVKSPIYLAMTWRSSSMTRPHVASKSQMCFEIVQARIERLSLGNKWLGMVRTWFIYSNPIADDSGHVYSSVLPGFIAKTLCLGTLKEELEVPLHNRRLLWLLANNYILWDLVDGSGIGLVGKCHAWFTRSMRSSYREFSGYASG